MQPLRAYALEPDFRGQIPESIPHCVPLGISPTPQTLGFLVYETEIVPEPASLGF